MITLLSAGYLERLSDQARTGVCGQVNIVNTRTWRWIYMIEIIGYAGTMCAKRVEAMKAPRKRTRSSFIRASHGHTSLDPIVSHTDRFW